MERVAVVSAARTAIGKQKGQWSPISEAELAAEAIKGAIERAGIEPGDVEDVIMGNVAGNRGNIARVAAFLAGCPEETSAYNLDRQCGSGSVAIANAASYIMAGNDYIYIGCGVEHMTRTPFQMEKSESAFEWTPPKYVTRIYAPLHMYPNYTMPQTTDKIAAQKGISRQQCDEFALMSQQRAAKAIKDGVFKDEIVPVEIKTRKTTYVADTDECVRYDANIESMSKLKPIYEGGVTTAGNSCPRSDGAGALVLMSERRAKEMGLKALGFVTGFASAGLDPTIMGYGPVPSVNKLLSRKGLKVEDIDLFEINEAFAGQAVASVQDLNIPIEKVNPNGGAIALGHPLGGTGAVLATKLLYEMNKKDYKKGIVTMCIGGGQGMAVLYERD